MQVCMGSNIKLIDIILESWACFFFVYFSFFQDFKNPNRKIIMFTHGNWADWMRACMRQTKEKTRHRSMDSGIEFGIPDKSVPGSEVGLIPSLTNILTSWLAGSFMLWSKLNQLFQLLINRTGREHVNDSNNNQSVSQSAYLPARENLKYPSSPRLACKLLARPTLSQFWSFKIRCTTFWKCINEALKWSGKGRSGSLSMMRGKKKPLLDGRQIWNINSTNYCWASPRERDFDDGLIFILKLKLEISIRLRFSVITFTCKRWGCFI